MTTDFLPQGYEAPSSSGGYMKFKDGENRFRILSRPIIGWEDWKDKKPLRFRLDKKPAAPIDPKKAIKHFWAFVVWNVTEERIQILEITQVTIQSAIQNLTKDEDWGNPFEYDIKVKRSGSGMETEYTVNPAPKSKVSQEVKDALAKMGTINLEALYDGGDPFDAKQVEVKTDVEPLPF